MATTHAGEKQEGARRRLSVERPDLIRGLVIAALLAIALLVLPATLGSDWIKTTNTGGYFSPGDDPARVTWFDDEM